MARVVARMTPRMLAYANCNSRLWCKPVAGLAGDSGLCSSENRLPHEIGEKRTQPQIGPIYRGTCVEVKIWTQVSLKWSLVHSRTLTELKKKKICDHQEIYVCFDDVRAQPKTTSIYCLWEISHWTLPTRVFYFRVRPCETVVHQTVLWDLEKATCSRALSKAPGIKQLPTRLYPRLWEFLPSTKIGKGCES